MCLKHNIQLLACLLLLTSLAAALPSTEQRFLTDSTSVHPVQHAELLPDPPAASDLPHTSIGVGFHLGIGQASAAVDFQNGTVANIASLQLGPTQMKEYMDMWRYVSDPENRRLAPPYISRGDYFRDLPRRQWRKALCGLNIPPTAVVRALGDVLEALRNAVTSATGHFPVVATVAAPTLPALYAVDFEDALKVLGMRYVDVPIEQVVPWKRLPLEGAMAYAANGETLCPHYKNSTRCREEELAFQKRKGWTEHPLQPRVLSVSLSQEALSWSYFKSQTTPFDGSESTQGVSSDLGFKHCPDEFGDDYIDYWERVSFQVWWSVLDYCDDFSHPPHECGVEWLTLYGEGAKETFFQGSMVDVAQNINHYIESKIFGFDRGDEFTAARGAAMLASRWNWQYRERGNFVFDT